MTLNVPPEIPQDPSDGYSRLPHEPEFRPIDVVLSIRSSESSISLQMFGEKVPYLPSGIYAATATRSPLAIQAEANRLRNYWHDNFVHYDRLDENGNPVLTVPFQGSIDLRDYEEVEGIVEDLANQGNNLLLELLSGYDEGARLREFRRIFMQLMAEDNLRVRFDSDLYLPWPMMALESGESTDPFSRFLGYRHKIDQTAKTYPWPDPFFPVDRITPVSSLNADSELNDVQWAREVEVLLDEKSVMKLRTSKVQLEDALRSSTLDDDVMYFWCHGEVQGNYFAIRLSDGAKIDASLVNQCRRRAGSQGSRFRPFVLLNSCYAGRLAETAEIEHLGIALINGGAGGVLGPQTEVPEIFGAYYALKFFERYFECPNTAGDVVHELAHEFAENERNPLALTYTLHMGMDSRMC